VRVGLTLEIRNSEHRPQPWRELYADCLWLFERAEELGFDSLLVQEHFFDADGYAPSMPIFQTALIERTETARIGSYIYVAPLHQPAQLAQETAVLDQLSGGRLDIGLGIGHRVAEYLAFGLNPKTRPWRTEEAIEIMKLAWRGEPFTYEGRYWDLHDLTVRPEPLQSPHPPVWMAATAPAPAERAGRHGLNLAAASGDPAVFATYREALAAHGHDPAAARVSNAWSITVTDEDPEAVWRRNKQHYHYRWDYYRKIRAEIGDADLDYGLDPGADAYRANELIGDADTVLATLEPFVRDFGLTDLVLFGPHPGIDLRGEGHESLVRFAEQVLPTLHSW
jgi:alkanesulfonate monooxygenase SsuD/methylene tetrahydromethanopterin reductase-like flavin-dependent oxidoreductase (luciferase family)